MRIKKDTNRAFSQEKDMLLFEKCVEDSELLRRLESTVIHWTRHIEEVVKNQASLHQADEGPLEEIEFWSARTVDLESIQKQLNQQGVIRIVNVLRIAGSSYLEKFDTLSGSIEKVILLNLLKSSFFF